MSHLTSLTSITFQGQTETPCSKALHATEEHSIVPNVMEKTMEVHDYEVTHDQWSIYVLGK